MTGEERKTALREGKRVFRARNKVTGDWWEGVAENLSDALVKATEALKTKNILDLELRESTGGGWKKCKEMAQ